jgi:hypothetical protein
MMWAAIVVPCARRVGQGELRAVCADRAKRATIAGMSWHHIPKDDAWKQAHLAMLGEARQARLAALRWVPA